jgi:carbamoyl-phosphate synthase small subunit
LHDWLETHDIVGISGIDTRALVQYIRDNGAQTIAINYNNSGYINDAELQQIITELKNWGSLAGKDLATQATITKQQSYDNPHNVDNDLEVAIIDFGCKQNIIESIIKRVKKLHILPANFDIQELRQLKPDGVLLSNGPADPKATYNKYQDNIDQLVNDTDSQLPIYGICLGYQILALALGCESYKMPLGHRGANHPIYNNILQKVEITSQNHGFAIKVDSLPKGIEATHYSLFDQTLEGFKHHQKQIFAVQHHPEASPGPHDSSYFFQDFLTACQNYAKKK